MTKRLIHKKQLSRPGPSRAPAAVAGTLLSLVEEYDSDPADFLQMIGLGHLAPVLLGQANPFHTISHTDFIRIYASTTAVLDNHAARQEGRDSLTKAGMDMMCYCIITCRTLRDVIARMAQFSLLLSPRTGRLTLDISGEIATLEMATERRVRNGCSYLSDLTGLAAYHRLFGWLIGEDIPLSSARLRYPPLLDPQTVAYLMPYSMQHRAAENALCFPAHYLSRAVVRSHHELEDMLGRFPFDTQAPQSKNAPLSERLSHLFATSLAGGDAPPTASHLAQQFSISLATLKRRLAAEGTSLALLKAAARRDLAETLLTDPRLSIADVARHTLFSDPGAFRRAFRRWTGRSPSDWRQPAPNDRAN